MAKMGRPSKYTEEMVMAILELARAGKTELAIAKELDICFDTITDWKKNHEDFSLALKAAKDVADEEIVATLRMKALGYREKAVKFWYDKDLKQVITHEYLEHYPPDTTSIIFWLKNRKPTEWRDVQRKEIVGADGKDLPQVILTMPANGSESND